MKKLEKWETSKTKAGNREKRETMLLGKLIHIEMIFCAIQYFNTNCNDLEYICSFINVQIRNV